MTPTTSPPDELEAAKFAADEHDWVELKLALNEAIWTKAPGTTTLAQAEEAACRAIGYLSECFLANQDAHQPSQSED